jgi:hypothetical protein
MCSRPNDGTGSASRGFDHLLHIGPVQLLNLLLPEKLTGHLQGVAVTKHCYLTHIMAGIKPPVAKLIKGDALPFDVDLPPFRVADLIMLAPSLGQRLERVALLDLTLLA